MADLAGMMMKKYGSKGGDAEEAAEGETPDEEGSKLGAKLASALKGGDGESIYNAFAALKSHCDMKG